MSDYLPVLYGPSKDVSARQAINGLEVTVFEYFNLIGYTPATALPVFPPVDPLSHPPAPTPAPTPSPPGFFDAWATYTPSVTAISGAYNNVTARGRYKKIGKTVFVQITVICTDPGSGNTGPSVALPFMPKNTGGDDVWILPGRTNSNYVMVQGIVSGNGNSPNVIIVRYDNNNPFPTSAPSSPVTLYVSGVYETG